MPRGRSPNRNKAYEIYRQHGGKITNRKIAEILNEDEKVIAVWKSRDHWKVVQQSAESCTTKTRGGQPGNKNAVGHGGTGPPGNKNALKTGEFETLLFDCLEPEEKELAAAVPADKEQLLLQEIRLLTVRERRMLKRIADLKKQDFTTVKKKKGTEKDKWTNLNEEHAVLGQIQSVEDALTRVQGRKQKAIEALHKFGFDDAHLELEIMKFELEVIKQEPSEREAGEDHFMEAMNGIAADVWRDDGE